MKYKNPVIPGFYPDPSVCRVGDDFYLVNSSFEYFPGVPIFHSRNLVNCPHNPILTHRSRGNLRVQATGHGDRVQDQNGHWWMVCLGIRVIGAPVCHILGRETFLTLLRWEDEWPVVGDSGQIAMEMEGHDGLPPVEAASWSTYDHFDGTVLPDHWNVLANPTEGAWRLTGSQLILRCGRAGLNCMEGQSWVGRRQQHFCLRASARIAFDPQEEWEEAGLTVFQNVTHHYDVAISRRAGRRTLIVRRTIGSLTAEAATVTIQEEVLTLVIESAESTYRLGYRLGDAEPVFPAEGESRYLSTEVGGRFTGVYIAMYATANGHDSDAEAQFEWFEYASVDLHKTLKENSR